jgi:hypothetical protein
LTSGVIHITGPSASGGEREYGLAVAGTWPDEVQKRLSNE